MADQADALIVGAGLAGLVAACELAGRGKKVILLDQEGRILARGLRGEALEQKLQELLGE